MTPQQQADEMARKCAENIEHMVLFEPDTCCITTMALQINATIPLVQLLECVEALRQEIQGLSLHEYLFTHFPVTQGHTPLRDFCIKQDKALTNLDHAMKGEKV